MTSQDGAREMSAVISGVLKYGVIASTILVVAGVVILFVDAPHSLPGSLGQVVSSNYGRPTLNLDQLLTGVSSGNPIFLIQLGLIVLLATPVARVAASVVMFAAEKDYLYLVVTIVVLGVLLLGLFVIGPIEAG